MSVQAQDRHWMQLALELAEQGRGHVEPNPLVGCVVVHNGNEIGRGWHQRFGGPHAEIEALRQTNQPQGATVYVNLEPCAHHGKTPPCAEALVQADVARVVIGMVDPFPSVRGEGIKRLNDAGIAVDVGVLDESCRRLNAPFIKRVTTGRPWVIAKWAMTLDGRIATSGGDSRWISGPESRAWVHRLRGRVDAIMVGRNTALKDNPLLTARPGGPRQARRVVFDSRLELPSDSQLVETAAEIPLMIVAGQDARDTPQHLRLTAAGCEVFFPRSQDHSEMVDETLQELAQRGATNVLVEGGGGLLGAVCDVGQIDEIYVFVAPKIIGGRNAVSPIAGHGIDQIASSNVLADLKLSRIGNDVCIHGLIERGVAR